MDEIFSKKKNNNPVALLSSDGIVEATGSNQEVQLSIVENIPTPEPTPSCSMYITLNEYQRLHGNTNQEIEQENASTSASNLRGNLGPNSLKRKRLPSPAYVKRNNILLDMKNDLKKMYEKRDKREEEKLQMAKRKLEDRERRTEIMREYVDHIKNRDGNQPN